MGRRLVGAAVAVVLLFGGGVAVAAPAAPGARAVTTPAAAPTPVAVGHARAATHRITGLAASHGKRKNKKKKGFFGRAIGRVLAFVAVALLLVVLVVLVVRMRRRNSR
ncbi:hypothetical protein [Kitasatospora sp. NPDC097643]|uniref:hypothetical protein n=1 Tax=Kitasatospora sp. NPDC097643 TaxID=3157230 RepID=UPI00332DE8D5